MLKQRSEASIILEQTFDNSHGSENIKREVKYSYKKSRKVDVNHSTTTSKIWKTFTTVKTQVKFNFSLKLELIKGIENKIQGAFEQIDKSSTTDGIVTKNTDEKTIEDSLKVEVDAFKSVKITVYQLLLKDVEWKYKAKLRVYGKGPSWENNGNIRANATRALLQKQFFNFDLVELQSNDDSMVFEEKGSIEGTFGLGAYTTVTDLNTGKILAFYSEDRVIQAKP